MGRRISVNILLVVGFGLVMAAIALPFAAEIIFTQAEKLEAAYRWKKAGEIYQRAAHLDPLNAKYLAEAGNFMLRQSKYRQGQDRLSWLKRAEKLYERARQLNPQYAEYWYLLGETQLAISKQYAVGSREKQNALNSAMENFRKTIERDPYNFRNNYLIGYNLLSVWDFLDDAGKDFARRRLGYVLQSRPDYSRYVYPAIIYYADDFGIAQEVTPETLAGYERLHSFIAEGNLWQFRKEAAQRLDYYRQKEQPDEFAKERLDRLNRLEEIKEIYRNKVEINRDEVEMERNLLLNLVAPKEWQGKAGKNEYRDGNMYWTGTMDTVINLPKNEAIIKIQAKGSPAEDVWPYMIMELDGEEIGETFVETSEWKEYSFKVNTDGGLKVLSVTFPNDLCVTYKGKREDRNLYVGEVRVIR